MPTGEIFISIVSGILLILITCLPLIPATLIYRLFPKTSLELKGPFKGLTLNASGAFAAYMIILIMIYPFALRNYQFIGGFINPTWQLDADMLFFDIDGKPQRISNKNNEINVLLKPDPNQVNNGSIRMLFPLKIGNDLPFVKVEVPGWGEGELNISKMKKGDQYTVDEFRKVIKIKEPLIVRESPQDYEESVAGKQLVINGE